MNLGIQSRLFFSFIATIAVVVLAMALAVNWSFQRGLQDYLSRVEVERLDRIITTLSKAYGEDGGWEFIRHNHRVWRQMLTRALDESGVSSTASEGPPPSLGRGPRFRRDRPPPELGPPPHLRTEGRPGAEGEGVPLAPPPPLRRPGPAPAGPLDLIPRLRLLDNAGGVVFGPARVDVAEIRRPIVWNDQMVGFLALQRNPFITDELALGFQVDQRRTYVLIATLALLLAALVSMLLARRMLRPVCRIADGARDLGAGHYGTRIIVDRGDELGRLAEDFNHLAAALERNEQTRRQWVADISHELRTPLGILRGEIEALVDGVRRASPERLESLHAEVLDLGKLVEDLYELALSDLGALNYHREPLDLAALIERTVDGFQDRFADKGLQLVNRVSGPCPLTGDARRLQQLFTNLLENSHRYTDPDGRLEIDLARVDGGYRISLQDTAPGVPGDALAHLFERLYRVDRSRSRHHGGAGLGLAICRNIVEAHGGHIDVENAELGGLALHIQLPITQ